uniref:C2 NT-type domain-containing protein n=1 Tax=Mesocestoides corti TaxID=53468 RepID=A0A5K3EP24_MESCO
MACVPIISNRRKCQFETTVNLHCLMAVPYVNAVIFTKLRLLNSRNSCQYSQRVAVVDNSVHWNSCHTFQCKMRTNPETNLLESCKLKVSVRMESEGGKSFHKIGYVIVDLACFAASGYVRCRRRYLLQGYGEDKRRAGKRQDNSLLVMSFTCQQVFGNTCFRVPPEDLSNCVSTSHSVDPHNLATRVGDNAPLHTPTTPAAAATSSLVGGVPGLARLPDESRHPFVGASPVLQLVGEISNSNERNEDTAVQMRSRRRRRRKGCFQSAEQEGEEAQRSDAEMSYEKSLRRSSPLGDDDEKGDHESTPPLLNKPDVSPSRCHMSSADEVLSVGECFSASSMPIDHHRIEEGEEGDGEVFYPLPRLTKPSFDLLASEDRLKKDGASSHPAAAAVATSSSPYNGSSTGSGSKTHSDSLSVLPSTFPDFSSLPIHSRPFAPVTRVGSGAGHFHTCPHVRSSSFLLHHQQQQQQRQTKKVHGADSGFQFSPGCEVTSEQCDRSSGFQSHSRNSSFGSSGPPPGGCGARESFRCVSNDLTPGVAGTYGDHYLPSSNNKQHLIDLTRAPHAEVVSQILRTAGSVAAATTTAAVSATPSASPRSTTG